MADSFKFTPINCAYSATTTAAKIPSITKCMRVSIGGGETEKWGGESNGNCTKKEDGQPAPKVASRCRIDHELVEFLAAVILEIRCY